MFFKEFEVRWSDVDANRHLANSAYINMMSHARMGILDKIGFNHETMSKLQVGPIVLRESIHYFKEIMPGQKVRVSVQLKELSSDRKFFTFIHRFFLDKGKNVAVGEMTGSWISLIERKIIEPPQIIIDGFDKLSKTDDFTYIDSRSIRLENIFPVHLK